MDVIIHADDFGIEPAQSARILECCAGASGGEKDGGAEKDAAGQGGLLNSLSIFANSPRFEDCAALLDARPEGLRLGVHLNFVEGKSCAAPDEVPLLVDEQGFFKLGYGGLLAGSFGGGAAELSRQLEVEAAAQIARVVGRFPHMADHLRLDGHQHTQLIPAVFKAVLAAAKNPDYHLDYLRIPAEPTAAFLQSGTARTIEPINWVKHELLNRLWQIDRRLLAESGLGAYEQISAVFCGVLFSGHMDEDRVSAVLPGLAQVAEKRGMKLELLFHPGRENDPMQCLNPNLPGFVEFSCSEGRDTEHNALLSKKLQEAVHAL